MVTCISHYSFKILLHSPLESEQQNYVSSRFPPHGTLLVLIPTLCIAGLSLPTVEKSSRVCTGGTTTTTRGESTPAGRQYYCYLILVVLLLVLVALFLAIRGGETLCWSNQCTERGLLWARTASTKVGEGNPGGGGRRGRVASLAQLKPFSFPLSPQTLSTVHTLRLVQREARWQVRSGWMSLCFQHKIAVRIDY